MQLKEHKLRPILLVMSIGIVLASTLMVAQRPTNSPVLRLTATSDNVSGVGDTVRVDLLRWSTDAERDQLVSAWTLTGTFAPRPPEPPPAPTGAGPARGGRGGAAAPAVPQVVAPEAGARGTGAPRGGVAPPSRYAVDDRAADAPAPQAATAPESEAAGGRGAVAAPGGARGGARGDAAAAGQGGRGRGNPGDAAAGARGGGPPAPAVPDVPPPTPETSLLGALKKAATIGFLWTSEDTGYSLRYAYRLPLPDGGERIILATDRRLGAWNGQWRPAGSLAATDYQFTIIELRLNPKGEGEGKASLTAKVTIDSAFKTIALADYSAVPAVLKGLKRQK